MTNTKVAKTFITIFAANQSTGKVGKEQLSCLKREDYSEAKQMIMKLGRHIDFEPLPLVL
jgi:predicted dinucleotide-binding enzyme